jgi:hypothetical protein
MRWLKMTKFKVGEVVMVDNNTLGKIKEMETLFDDDLFVIEVLNSTEECFDTGSRITLYGKERIKKVSK